MSKFILLFAFIIPFISGQNVGTNTAEFHPPLVTSVCSAGNQCTSQTQSIVLDANWRWLHNVGGSTNCYSGNTWNSNLCPNGVDCAANCALEGVDSNQYKATYGISTSGSQLSLGFVTKGPYSTNIGSRVYLMQDDSHYQIFKLKNKEFTFDVDVSQLPCGLNGALYFSEMSADGGLAAYPANKAGAKYGTGYCDAQCPHDIKFINGEANSNNWVPSPTDPNSGSGHYGSCCGELDIWEANSISTAFTPHPCNVVGQTRCDGIACGDGAQRYDGVCDKDGCDFNSYRMGNQSYYGPGQMIDTNSVMTVVTQFITSDNTDNGDLVAIRRFYKQGDTVFENSDTTFSEFPEGSNEITDDFCSTQKTLFNDRDIFTANGGLRAMGESMQRGMVLVVSLWDDHAAHCLWLDSTYPTTASPSTPGAARGTCPTTSGVPADVEANSPNAAVKFSNIRTGPIGTTVSGLPNGPTSAPTNAPTSAPTNAPTNAPTSAPTNAPTNAPTSAPTDAPTDAPTSAPTDAPTDAPTSAPTDVPTEEPTAAPTDTPIPPTCKIPIRRPTTPTLAPPVEPTPEPEPCDCDESSIVITESPVNSWGTGDDTITQFSVSISTTCTTQNLVALTLHASNWHPQNFWGFTASGDSVTIASGVTITESSPFTWAGYQNQFGSAGFSVESYTFE